MSDDALVEVPWLTTDNNGSKGCTWVTRKKLTEMQRIQVKPVAPDETDAMIRIALAAIRAGTATLPQGTVNAYFQSSREGTTGKLRGHAIVVTHSCNEGTASPCWLVVYTGKGRFWHVDARRAFNRDPWYGEQLHGAEQRRRFLRDLNDRFESVTEFAAWCVAEDMPRIHQDLTQSPIEEPATLQRKADHQWTL
jgi:hypothetical protein